MAYLAVNHYEKISILENIVGEYKIGKLLKKIENQPNSLERHAELAQLLLKYKELAQYEKEMEHLKKVGVNTTIFDEKLGDYYFKKSNFEKALELYKEALASVASKDNLLHFKIANSYLNMGELERAINEYNLQLDLLKYQVDRNKSDRIKQFIVETINRIKRQKHERATGNLGAHQ
jgi:tetratricopeptide (TPR) repeat protein